MLQFFPSLTERPLRLLCLGAHCDDIEIGCGGTVLRLLAERDAVDVHWVVFSSDPEREREQRASAAEFLAGAREQTLDVKGFRESFFPEQWSAIKQAFEELKRGPGPDLILTHHVADLHQDHRVLAELTWNTFRDHAILEYEIPKYDGDLGRPGVYVPLSRETADRKIRSILRHFASQRQRSWFDEETFRALLRLRGLEANAPERYAEAFHSRKLVLATSP